MLAVSGPLPPDDGAWVFEGKWDGVRALISVTDGGLAVRSRNELDTTRSWPELAGVRGVPSDTVLDAEIVTLNARGAPDFGLLQQRMHVRAPSTELVRAVPVVAMVFDVLRLAGTDLTGQAWTERRAVLDGLQLAGALQGPPAFDGPGAAVLDACVRQGLEGVVAKRRNSPYLPGRRSGDWIKVKPLRRQEFVIGGWEAGQGGRSGRLGALLLGVGTPAGRLRYVGKVGTGFTDRSLQDLAGRLAPLQAPESPFTPDRPDGVTRAATWVRPELVCEVEFLAWTGEDRLRHPSYKGLRSDRAARDVIREPG